MAVTIKHVAQRAGVSMSTVSHVLNGTHYVSPELTARVLQAVNETGYELNPVARRLAGGRARIVGLFTPELRIDNNYVMQILSGVDEVLADAEYDLFIQSVHLRKNNASPTIGGMIRAITDGLLILLPQDPEGFTARLRQRKFPYVVIDEVGSGDIGPTVTAANWRGAYDAVSYLLDLGHRRIGFIEGRPYMSSSRTRREGYEAALSDRGITPDPALVACGSFTRQGGHEAAEVLLRLPDRPTAIFAANDRSALGAIDAARMADLQIPADLSVIGFDDTDICLFADPRLTTVRQPLSEFGRAASRLLLTYIDNPDASVEHLVLPTELIIRESCAPPRR